MQNPKISVLMPVYNTREDWLKEAIDSILNQTFSDFELLVIDDKTSDENEKILKQYNDIRIKYIKGDKKGIAHALNKGIELAKGEYIARMDSDDISLPYRFEKQVKFLDKNPDISIVGSWFEMFPEKRLIKHPIFPKYLDFLRENSIGHPTVMFRKKDFEKYDLTYVDDYACEDYELWSRAIRFMTIANMPEVLLKYRWYGGNATNKPQVLVDDNRIKQNMLDFLTDDKELQQKIRDVVFKKPRKKNILSKIYTKIKNKIRKLCSNVRIVKLMGGLGNQMFQYAFGKSLEKATGQRVVYDKTWFEEVQKQVVNEKGENSSGVVMRKFELNIFDIDIPFATKKELKYCINTISEEKEFEFDENLLKKHKLAVYKGYFQNEGYLKNIKDELKKDFTFPEIKQNDEFNQYWLNKIRACENPVFVHIRRGDYVNLGWDLSNDYYKKAIEYIKQNVKNPTFFIFGQSCEDYIKKELNFDIPFEIIGEENSKNKEDWKDIVLMEECKHAIIANSTFSWWGAYLGKANDGIVTAPTSFINGKDGIICENWVKIETCSANTYKIHNAETLVAVERKRE